jgi:membrane-associated phospholipid phosphatase
MRPISTVQKEKWVLKGVFRFFSLKLITISSLFLGSLFVFGFIMHEAVYENEQAFDNRVFALFSTISTGEVIKVMEFFTFFGSSHFLLPAYIVLIGFFAVQKKFRYALHIGLIALSSTGLMLALKNITHRHRPELPIIKGITNYSFPSGHALSAFIFCGIFVYITWHSQLSRGLKWLFSVLLFIFGTMIAFSRIILKVHYPTDIIASFCLGIVWSVMSLWLMHGITKKIPQEPKLQ